MALANQPPLPGRTGPRAPVHLPLLPFSILTADFVNAPLLPTVGTATSPNPCSAQLIPVWGKYYHHPHCSRWEREAQGSEAASLREKSWWRWGWG